MGSTSAGGSGLGFGFSIGSTWRDGECVRRLNARELAATIGDREAAREVLCANEDIFRVYNALGRPCRLTPKGERNPLWVEAAAAPPPPPPAPPPPPPPEHMMAPPPEAPARVPRGEIQPGQQAPMAKPAPSQANNTQGQTPEYPLSFADGATALDPANTQVLEAAVAGYPRWGTVRVIIAAMAEPRILQLRVDTVRAYLTSRGVPGVAQVIVVGTGVMPILDRKDPPARLNGNAPVAGNQQKPDDSGSDAAKVAAESPIKLPSSETPVAREDSAADDRMKSLHARRDWLDLPH